MLGGCRDNLAIKEDFNLKCTNALAVQGLILLWKKFNVGKKC
jgi:hypothetical protein